jgi:opacity protein-like surface antigen
LSKHEDRIKLLANRFVPIVAIFALLAGSAVLSAQVKSVAPYYARLNTFGVFSAYSGDSSHMLLGSAQNRKLLDFGAYYSHRLLINHIVNWQYNGELLPVALESDPVVHIVLNETSPNVQTTVLNDVQVSACSPALLSYNFDFSNQGTTTTFSGTEVVTCTRQWTIGEGVSPVGFQWNFLPRHKTQPFLIGHGGYMYSTQPIPIPNAGSFNFTFDVGAGVELYRTRTKSIRAEYRFHHISNHNTANENPGIDNGLYQVTYSFGK